MDIKEVKYLMKQCLEYKVIKAPNGVIAETSYLGMPYHFSMYAEQPISASTALGLDMKMEAFINSEAEEAFSKLQGGKSAGAGYCHIEAMQKYIALKG